MAGTLVFSTPPDGSGRLVFGDQGGGVVAPDAVFGIDTDLPGLGSLTLAAGPSLALDVPLPGLDGDVPLGWDANVSRGGLRAELQAHWQQRAQPVAAALATHWQQAMPLRVGTAVRWQDAAPARGALTAAWQEAERLRAGVASHWQEGQRLRAALDVRWQDAVRLRAGVASRWQEGEHRRAAVLTHWQETLRLRAGVASHWQEAQPRRALVASEWGHGRPVRIHVHAHWQEAMRPRSGVTQPPKPPEPRPPCYDPATLGRLVFDTAISGDGRLVFICHRSGTDPEPPRYVIPLLRVYVTVHSTSAHLLPSLEPVALQGIVIGANDDGFGWTLQASGPEHLMDQLAPVAGLPARVRVTLDGIQWVFAVERPERSRKFGERKVQVRGSSVTALLGADYMPEQAWSSVTDLTAQQLVERALEFTGVTVDWGLPDWLVPASAWSHMGTPLSVARRVAEAAGAVVRSHRTEPVLQFAPQYPLMPWEWAAATPDVRMPGQIITSDTLQYLAPPRYNAVYVSGSTDGGTKGHVVITGSAEDMLAPPVVDALITHEIAARQRGRAVLAAANITARQPITVPLLTGGTNPGLILPGYLIEVAEPGETWRGLVRGLSITAGMPTVRQALTVERAL